MCGNDASIGIQGTMPDARAVRNRGHVRTPLGCNIDINRFESGALLPGKFAYWKTSYGIDYKIEPVYCSIELILVFIGLINLME